VPSLLIAFGIGVAALLAYRGSQPSTPTSTEAAFLVLASSALNIAGAALLARIGRADPRHARSALRRLLSVGRDAGKATAELQLAIESEDAEHLRLTAASVHAHLESVQLHLSDAMLDWNDVHREALREVVREAGAEIQRETGMPGPHPHLRASASRSGAPCLRESLHGAATASRTGSGYPSQHVRASDRESWRNAGCAKGRARGSDPRVSVGRVMGWDS
jgi:hypothetical protein